MNCAWLWIIMSFLTSAHHFLPSLFPLFVFFSFLTWYLHFHSFQHFFFILSSMLCAQLLISLIFLYYLHISHNNFIYCSVLFAFFQLHFNNTNLLYICQPSYFSDIIEYIPVFGSSSQEACKHHSGISGVSGVDPSFQIYMQVIMKSDHCDMSLFSILDHCLLKFWIGSYFKMNWKSEVDCWLYK